jgi:23S rRNA (cytidine1920-2'-O)/16S rRNA (cytidine1409-2'-O)-methyltransferase
LAFALGEGFALGGLTTSPITGPAGNIEFLAWLRWGVDGDTQDIEALIEHEINPH